MTEKKPKFSEIVAYEKSILNPIRYHANYRVVPAYVVFAFVVIALSCILMAIDENYFKYHFIVLMILFAVVSVALIVYGRAVVKREIRDEVNRYDLDYTQVPDSVVYDYYNENGEILFSDEGMHVNDDFYWYNHMRIRILYEMYLHRVIIRVGFSTEKNGTYIIPFDARSIKMLYQFNVRVENAEEMERILKDTYSAFEAIYKKGKL